MLDGKAIGSQVLEAVRGYVSRSVSELSARISDLDNRLKAIPSARDGKDGIDGKDGATGKDGRNGVDGKDGHQGERGESGAHGEKGIDGINGRDGVDGKSVCIDDLLPTIKQWFDSLPPPANGIDGKDGTNGHDGVDGMSITAEDIIPTVKQWFDAIPLPVNGKDGADGKTGIDGKSVSIEDFRHMFEAEQAKALLELERRGTDLIQRCIDRIEKPKDGLPGKDGRDALDLEHFDLVKSEDGRTITIALIRGDDRVEKSVVIDSPIYRGIYKHGETYQRGDWVTFGGSVFAATRDTDSKPETDDSFRLTIKRGRDGKDGIRGEKGERGMNAKDYKEARSNWSAS